MPDVEPDGLESPAAEVLETMGTTRAMRHFAPGPVPEWMIERLVWAATRAPSPHNTQCWDFVVVTDAEVRAQVAQIFSAAATRTTSAGAGMTARGLELMANVAQAPVIVFVCGTNVYPPAAPDPVYMYSAVYAAAQNLVLAARAMQLGATFTAFHRADEPALRQLLAIPADRTIAVTVPIGWPGRRFGPVRRRPLQEVLHRDRW